MIILKESNDFNRYMNDLDEKIIKAKEASADTPRIGIFWLCLKDGQFKVFFSEPITLEFGEDYGTFIVAAQEHYNMWEALKRHNFVPRNSEYEDLPRGRVAYDKEARQYVVYTGKYLKSTMKSTIISDFKLKSNTRWETDLHYNQFKRWGF
jgi:hypothetical protein